MSRIAVVVTEGFEDSERTRARSFWTRKWWWTGIWCRAEIPVIFRRS
jgi:hypothetical protein